MTSTDRKAPMTPEQYVQDKAARSGSSFYYAFLFLPPDGVPRSRPSTLSAARWTTWWMMG